MVIKRSSGNSHMKHKVAFSFADGKTFFFPVEQNEILIDAAINPAIKYTD